MLRHSPVMLIIKTNSLSFTRYVNFRAQVQDLFNSAAARLKSQITTETTPKTS